MTSSKSWRRDPTWSSRPPPSSSAAWTRWSGPCTSAAACSRASKRLLRTHIGEANTVPLCGNSIGTDRRFLAAWLPEIEEFLHYRSVDVSTVKELARRWYPDAYSAAPKKSGAHRALDDIKESVEELRYYRKTVFK
jgi:oligoribonuclease